MSNSVLDRLDQPKVETISLVYRGTDKILKIIINFWGIKRNKEKQSQNESKYMFFIFKANLIIWMNRL